MSNPTDPKRRALGKGLESLLPSHPAASVTPLESAGKPLEIAVDQIDRNPLQTRTRFDEAQLQELAASITSSGVIQPIVVKALTGGRYQLITGERRLLASRIANKTHIPAIVRNVSDQQAMEMTIIENLQRADLNPMEQAKAYQRLSTDFKLSQEQMATRTGKDRASIANFLRLLKLPEAIQHKVEAGELSFGHARTLLALQTTESITLAAQKIIALAMSVRQTETYVHGLLNPERKPGKADRDAAAANAQDPNVREAQEQLQRALGLKVRIEDKKGKGRVIIEYSGVEDFDAILTALGDKPEA